MTIQTIQLNKLALSDLNVRKVKPKEIEALAADIQARGVLQNLIGYDEDGKIKICAGGRRYRALKLLQKAKTIPGTFEVPVEIRSKDEALEGADCLVVCTEWKTFWSPDFDKIKATLRQPVIIDGRNLYDPRHLASMGLEYYGIGRGLSVTQC